MVEVIIPVATAALGYLVANWKDILGWKRRTQKEEIEISEQLMNAVDDGHAKIIKAYAIISEMDVENRRLKSENMELTIDRDKYKSLSEQLKDELQAALKDFEFCSKQLRNWEAKKVPPVKKQ